MADKQIITITLDKIKSDRIKSRPEEAWKKYICPNCNSLLEDAVQLACGHRLCKGCATEVFEREDNPWCLVTEDDESHRMIPDDVEDQAQKFFPDKFAQRDISKIEVLCQFTGCDEVVTVKALKSHIGICKFAGKECSYCHKYVLLTEMDNHEYECPNMEKACPCAGLEWSSIGGDDLQSLSSHVVDINDAKNKWTNALATCKQKVPPADYRNHVRGSNEDHLKLFVVIVSILMSLYTSLLKEIKSPTDVEKDGAPKKKPQIAANSGRNDDVVADNGTSDIFTGIVESLKKQFYDLKALVTGIQKDSNQAQKELVATQNDLAATLELNKDLRAKVDFFEQKLSNREQQLEEKDFRISLLEAANYDGTMIWRISGFDMRTKDARDARYTSIFSLPFYTNKYGYKMCLRLYPLGDGMGKNTHLSLFFVVMKSEYDSLLQWPFTNKVTLTLINQSGGPDVNDTFKPDPKSSSFQRPKTEMNVASGCPRFVLLDDLHRNGFIKDDTIFIKVKVESISTRY